MILDFTLSALLSFAIMAALMPRTIPILHRLKFGQEVREDGPKSHIKKQGTPTMGGIVIVLAVLISCLFTIRSNPEELPVLFLTVGFGLVGFTDDYLKIVKHQSEGFNPKQKFFCQLVITAVFSVILSRSPRYSTDLLIPFTSIRINLGIWYIPAVLFIVTATDNGANFTDGLDGLAGSVTSAIALFLGIFSMYYGHGALSPVCGAVLGALLGFLIYNSYPAKVFMGDTGSLALGGFVAAAAFEMNIPLFIPIFAFIYLLEVLSVIIQVTYFKATKGKRFFRMAPIHHHFELMGWSETRVVTVFTAVTVLLCLVSFVSASGIGA